MPLVGVVVALLGRRLAINERVNTFLVASGAEFPGEVGVTPSGETVIKLDRIPEKGRAVCPSAPVPPGTVLTGVSPGLGAASRVRRPLASDPPLVVISLHLRE